MGPEALLAGAQQTVNTGLQIGGNLLANYQNQKFSQHMYEKQKTDNLDFWRQQNDYNSPQAQMRRFQEAGLNPNLIYGQGNSGNASTIQSPDIKGGQNRSIFEGIQNPLNVIGAYQDATIKQAQTDNLKTQNGVLQSQQALNIAKEKSTLTQEQRQQFDLDFAKSMADTQADYLRAKTEVEKAEAGGREFKVKYSNQKLLNDLDIQEQIRENYKARTGVAISTNELLNYEKQIKAFEAKMVTSGFSKSMISDLVKLFISSLLNKK